MALLILAGLTHMSGSRWALGQSRMALAFLPVSSVGPGMFSQSRQRSTREGSSVQVCRDLGVEQAHHLCCIQLNTAPG